MFPVIRIGPLALQAPGLFLLLGAWLGAWWAEKNASRFNLPPNWLTNLILYTLLAGVLGARVVYALRNPSAFATNLLSLLSPSPAMLNLEGGLLIGAITALALARRKFKGSANPVSLWSVLDALTPGFAIFAIALGLSHLASGDAYGSPTHLPWGIWLWGTLRHPTQVYEIILGGLIAGMVWRQTKKPAAPGMHFLVYLALTASAQIILGTFRGDSMIIFGNLRGAQVAGLVVLALSLWLMGKRYPYSPKPPTI